MTLKKKASATPRRDRAIYIFRRIDEARTALVDAAEAAIDTAELHVALPTFWNAGALLKNAAMLLQTYHHTIHQLEHEPLDLSRAPYETGGDIPEVWSVPIPPERVADVWQRYYEVKAAFEKRVLED